MDEFRQWEQMNYKNQNYAINKDHPTIHEQLLDRVELAENLLTRGVRQSSLSFLHETYSTESSI